MSKRVLLVLGHGRSAGLGHHLLETAVKALTEAGAETRVHDLLNDGFDPVLRLAEEQRTAQPCSPQADPLVHRYQEDVRWADGYVVLHPVWWFSAPAILKGWIDRVLVDQVAIRERADGPPAPLLGGRRAMLVQTFGAARMVDVVVFGGLATRFWRRAVFAPIGITGVRRLALYGAEAVQPNKLAAFEERLRRELSGLIG